MRLIVAIPALNEENTVAAVVRGVPRDIRGVDEVQVIVIDDGSTDATAALSVEAGATVLSHAANRGLGASFQTALTYAIERRGDLLVSIDGDGQFNPADVATIVGPVVAGRAAVCTASRFVDPAFLPEMPAIKRWGNRQMSRLISKLTGQTLHDVSCGMRCYNRQAMLSINLMGAFNFSQEVLLNLAFKQLRIVEVPIAVRGVREFGKSRVASNLWKYALNTSRIIFRAYRDYKPMRFFGKIALWLSAGAALLEIYFLYHYLTVGRFYGALWAGFSGAGVLGLALVSLHMGLIGDMLTRHRIYLEQLLYYQRDNAWRDPAANAQPPRASEAVRAAAHRQEEQPGPVAV